MSDLHGPACLGKTTAKRGTQQSQCCHIGKAILCGTATLESWEGEGALFWALVFHRKSHLESFTLFLLSQNGGRNNHKLTFYYYFCLNVVDSSVLWQLDTN